MTPDFILANLLAYSIQITCVIAAGWLLALLFRVRDPHVELRYWHALLVACLLLPLLQRWTAPALGEVTFGAAAFEIATPQPGSASSLQIPWRWIVFAALVLGIALRFTWLGLGFMRLRSLRRSAARWTSPQAGIADSLGVEAAIHLTDEVSGPVAFGWRKPHILLPSGFARMTGGQQRAILCHELLHVRRGDWAFMLVEEFIRALLWFQPAIWWLLGQVQLSREQAVDREAVRFTNDRDEYLQALLAIATVQAEPDLAPAPLFLRKHHLATRVASILKEVSMSKRRIAVSMTAIGVSLFLAGRFAVSAFPLQAPVALQVSGLSAGPKLLHSSRPEYPSTAKEKGVEGQVILEVSIDEKGNVSDARVLSGPEELRAAALRSVLQWHYDPAGAPTRTDVTINFSLERDSASARSASTVTPTIRLTSYSFLVGKQIGQIQFEGLSDSAKERVASRLPIRIGDTLTQENAESLVNVVHETDEHLRFRFVDSKDRVAIVIYLPQSGMLAPPPPLPPPPPADVAARDQTTGAGASPQVRVGGAVQASKIIQKINPEYPALAKEARLQGTVRLDVLIAANGSVKEAQLVTGHPLLAPAALEAVRQWIYQPTLLNGNPIEVRTVVDVNFTLSE